MRYQVAVAGFSLITTAAIASDGGARLLKDGESPPKGWSVVVLQTDSAFGGGRMKVGASDTCSNYEGKPCHFAAPDGSWTILLDQPLEHGDTTATINVSGERIYILKTGQNMGRAAAHVFFGVLGAALTQPEDAKNDASAAPARDGPPLANVRAGSRFDLEFVSVSEPGKAVGFAVPAEN